MKLKMINRFQIASFFEWIVGSKCIFCNKEIKAFSKAPVCYCCYREIKKEFFYLRFKTEKLTLFALSEYIGLIKELFYWTKFKNSVAASYFFYKLVAHEFAMQNKSDLDNILLIPAPCSRKSKLMRGWDPVTLVANELANHYNVKKTPLVKRRFNWRHTKQQKKLNKVDRISASLTRFCVDKKELSNLLKSGCLANINKIVMIDDVMTTGATLEAIMEQLQNIEDVGVKPIEAWVVACD